MFTQEEYMWGWGIYLTGAVLCFAWFVFVTRRIPLREAKAFLWALCAVIVFLPITNQPDSDYLAPAWVVTALDAIFVDPKEWVRAGVPLAVSSILGAIGAVIIVVVVRFFGGNKEDTSQKADS